MIQEYNDSSPKTDFALARILFARKCNFIASSATSMQLPKENLPEVAFIGRSNVGKSSLVNALTGRKNMARKSNTPGRTQEIIFFNLSNQIILVDLPGYGYAKASKVKQAKWLKNIFNYLRYRGTLYRVSLLIDSRHGATDKDDVFMDMLDRLAVSYQVVLTKVDKVKQIDLNVMIKTIITRILHRPAAYPIIGATSAVTGVGILELQAELTRVTNIKLNDLKN
ncbi:putative GTP-binding protein engB [Candidatus Endolissoclinum faulkneri L5]|uniref:Probable GTP-binding protein EngB n=1 Tax=Candidatus Endolissoclinum faulkneri L5 TaxID=1401328 RepID=V9TVU6_9PROT|nr:ribosome biogenesis GTP-binding protein YihA/YsxC [Candidatus Endolissoclinum faulkneri]AHC73823.1 putative GTP-binding protein engB [Candidatus Endolissoclinum faulkneri L5]